MEWAGSVAVVVPEGSAVAQAAVSIGFAGASVQEVRAVARAAYIQAAALVLAECISALAGYTSEGIERQTELRSSPGNSSRKL